MLDKTRNANLKLLSKIRPHASSWEKKRIDTLIWKITHEEDIVRMMREELLKQQINNNLGEYKAMNDYIHEHQDKYKTQEPILNFGNK